MKNKTLKFTLIAAAAVFVLAKPTRSIAENSFLPNEAKLQVQSVRLGRSAKDFKTDSGGRAYIESSPGATLQLLLTMNRGYVLTPSRDAVSIDTFIDDTYQNFLDSNSGNYSYHSQPSFASQDGRSILFTVATSRPIADDASRLFVRGKIKLTFVAGESLIARGKIPLNIGHATKVGPFTTWVTAIASQPSAPDSRFLGMNLTLSLHGQTQRLLKVRVLDPNNTNTALNDPQQTYLTDTTIPGPGNAFRPNVIQLRLNSIVTNAVLAEFTYAEKVEQISIPFEVPIDLGAAKAGPINLIEGSQRTARTNVVQRQWPPLTVTDTNLSIPPARARFTPEERPNQKAK